LRSGARFNDGGPVTPDDVRAAWAARMSSAQTITRGGFPIIEKISITGDRSFSVSSPDASSASPDLFGNPALAIAGASGAGNWLAGTGPFVVDSTASQDGQIVLRPARGGAGLTLIVRADSALDQRDQLDRGADILETRDPLVLAYAERGGYQIYPLPFNRTYALAIPARAGRATMSARDSTGFAQTAAFRATLARDAVRGEARAAAPPGWWRAYGTCRELTARSSGSGAAQGAGARRILYEPGDAAARALAERLVAIVRTAGVNASDQNVRDLRQLAPELLTVAGATITAAPADASSLRAGSALAYIISMPRNTTAHCMELRRLQTREGGGWISPAALVPLLDTRSFVVARAGAPAASVDWDGTLRIHPSPPGRGAGTR
jgi:hypothetical protein